MNGFSEISLPYDKMYFSSDISQSSSSYTHELNLKYGSVKQNITNTGITKSDCLLSDSTCSSLTDLYKLGLQSYLFDSIQPNISFMKQFDLSLVNLFTGIIFPKKLFDMLMDRPFLFYSQDFTFDPSLIQDGLNIHVTKPESFKTSVLETLGIFFYNYSANSVLLRNSHLKPIRLHSTQELVTKSDLLRYIDSEFKDATNDFFIGSNFRTAETEELLNSLCEYTGRKNIILDLRRFNSNISSIPTEILEKSNITVITDGDNLMPLEYQDIEFTFDSTKISDESFIDVLLRKFKSYFDNSKVSTQESYPELVDLNSVVPYRTRQCNVTYRQDTYTGLFVETMLENVLHNYVSITGDTIKQVGEQFVLQNKSDSFKLD